MATATVPEGGRLPTVIDLCGPWGDVVRPRQRIPVRSLLAYCAEGRTPDLAGAEIEPEDGEPFRGLLIGLLLSVPMWALVALIVRRLIP